MRIVVNLAEHSEAFLGRLAPALPADELVAAPADGPVPDDVRGEVLLTRSLDSTVLRELLGRGIGWVHVLGTGVDGFPLEGVDPGTALTCSRGASAVPISEFVLAAMLAFEKRLPETWIDSPPERWNQARLGVLSGKTCVVVGLGAIGTEVARRALAFDMDVVGVRRRAVPSGLYGVRVAGSLAEALPEADHLVVAAPATAETERLLGPAELGKVKPGVHVVNVARGTLVDQAALLAALDDGRVAMASLDVVDPEPLPTGHPLYSHPRVRLSPHVSWSGPITLRLILQMFLDNVARYRAGADLEGVVDTDLGY